MTLENGTMLYGRLPQLELSTSGIKAVRDTLDELRLSLPYWGQRELNYTGEPVAIIDVGRRFLEDLRKRLTYMDDPTKLPLLEAIRERLAWHRNREGFTLLRKLPPIAQDSPFGDLPNMLKPNGKFDSVGSALQRDGVITVGDLCGYSAADLLDIRQFGIGRRTAVLERLAAARNDSNRHWLHLREE